MKTVQIQDISFYYIRFQIFLPCQFDELLYIDMIANRRSVASSVLFFSIWWSYFSQSSICLLYFILSAKNKKILMPSKHCVRSLLHCNNETILFTSLLTQCLAVSKYICYHVKACCCVLIITRYHIYLYVCTVVL